MPDSQGPFPSQSLLPPQLAVLAVLSAWLFTGARRNDGLKTPPNTQTLSYREGQGAGRGGWCCFSFTMQPGALHCTCPEALHLPRGIAPSQEISSDPALVIFRSLSLFLLDIKACRNLQGVRSSQTVWYLLELMWTSAVEIFLWHAFSWAHHTLSGWKYHKNNLSHGISVFIFWFLSNPKSGSAEAWENFIKRKKEVK